MPREHVEAVDAEAAKKKKQLVIVALLLAGLLIAICTQPSSESDKTSARPVSLKSFDSKPLGPADAPRDEITATREFSRIEIDRILQTSLFDVPVPAPVSVEEIVQAERTIPAIKVQAIYGDGKLTKNSKSSGHRVLIGRAIIQSGEVLPDGRQIVRVTPDGVELAQ